MNLLVHLGFFCAEVLGVLAAVELVFCFLLGLAASSLRCLLPRVSAGELFCVGWDPKLIFDCVGVSVLFCAGNFAFFRRRFVGDCTGLSAGAVGAVGPGFRFPRVGDLEDSAGTCTQ